jgi:3-oxoadipate CoA-transferase beta subunit
MSGWTREQIAARAAADIPNGAYVNLGIGQPERVADFVPTGREIVLHSENGILGMGPAPAPGKADMELINAGKKPVTIVPGAAFFHHADSFAMIRGGHIDVCILGAYQVSCGGDIANWSTGDDGTPAVGGAMDLVAGARDVRVMMSHRSGRGEPKLLRALTLPATGRNVVKRVYTELGIVDPVGDAFRLIELAPGVGEAELREATGAPVIA